MSEPDYDTFRFEPPDSDDPVEVWCWNASFRGRSTETEVFEIGEPVYLSDKAAGPDSVWWIRNLIVHELGKMIDVEKHDPRPETGAAPRLRVSPVSLRKVPEMLRIALETERPY